MDTLLLNKYKFYAEICYIFIDKLLNKTCKIKNYQIVYLNMQKLVIIRSSYCLN